MWRKAVEIFTDRIEGRFLSQIRILTNDVNTNGFSIMALNCLLIETMLQFKIGKNTTPTSNSEQYSNFLQEIFPTVFTSDDSAKAFYGDIRCGILHSAQTKGYSKLTCENSYVVRFDGRGVTVSVEQFSISLNQYFEEYKQKLLDRSQVLLRTNFIKKMRYVCR